MRSRTLTIAVVAAVVTSGCASFADAPAGPRPAPESRVVLSAPDQRLTVLDDADPVEAAAGMSRALFDRSPVVVVARDGDLAGVQVGASAAEELGVPLLLEPSSGGVSDVLATEVARLDVDAVLAVGEADGRALGSATTEDAGRDGHEVVSAPADPAAVAEASGELPSVDRPDPLAGTVVLAAEGPGAAAAVGTARAAGAPVVLTDKTDPRASEAVREALAGAEAVVAVGAGFVAETGLDWKVATAVAGDELPGGGQLLFPGRMLVALYGHPGAPALGVLGEQGLEASIERAREHGAAYEDLVDPPVVPTFEIIATVASSAAGADGNYSAEADPEVLRPWVEAAGEAGVYVLLDLQPGRTDFVTQAERYRSLLELPHVGLALDPEWRLGPNEVHLTQIGSVDIEEVNRVVAWLADLTRENALPQKLLVLHQFRLSMLPDRERLDTSREELAVMVHVDGQGSQGDKQATWAAVRQNAPAGLTWGWKNFYDEDQPVLTPEQTVAQVDPLPELVTYQ